MEKYHNSLLFVLRVVLNLQQSNCSIYRRALSFEHAKEMRIEGM